MMEFAHMFKLRVVAAVVCIIFLSSVILIPFANADWIMFRSDPSHSGAGAGNPVLAPTLLWNYKTSSDGTGHVYSSPAVANGVIYVSSWIFKIVNKMSGLSVEASYARLSKCQYCQ